jgi:hypothetical protein
MPGNAIVAATEATLMTQPPLPAAPAGPHGAEGVLDPQRGAEDVDVELAAGLPRLEVDEQAGDLDPGVVHQDVEPAQSRDCGGDCGVLAGVVGDVEVDVDVTLAERLGDLGAEILLEVGHHHRGAPS